MYKIVSSPKYGIYMNSVFKILSGAFVTIMTLGLIATIIAVFATGAYKEFTEDDISLGMVFVICVLTDVLISVFFIRQCLFDRDLKLWRQDFVKIYAKVITGLDNNIITGGPKLLTMIRFEYDGKEHEVKFGAAYNMWARNKAFSQVGQKIPLYYSPKYDQIVFIKENP